MQHPKLTEIRAIEAERKVLIAALTPRWFTIDKLGSRTCLRRKGTRVRTKVLRYINRATTGKFAIGKRFIAFELEADALMYRIMYPS